VYKETDLDAMEIQGIGSDSECQQIYESDLHKCELVRDCCPQFERFVLNVIDFMGF
jgi:hypothetical protein